MNEMIVHEPQNQVSLFDRSPKALVEGATEIADVLSGVIEKRKLYAIVQGKRHVLVEGWTTMGALLGIAAVERETKELPDGSYEAIVDLKRMRDGMIVGSGSALCSIDEKRWAKADKYARRSMAITRATSKAFRLGYSWIMVMSGYEACPAEEIPATTHEEEDDRYYGRQEQKVRLHEALKARGVTDTEIMKSVHNECMGKSRAHVNKVIDEAAEMQANMKE